MFILPSIRMEQFDPQWTESHEPEYLSIFENLSRKYQLDKKNGYFT